MLANYLIGLREGLEASLIVGILIAYLVKRERRDAVKTVILGVVLAILVSLGAALALSAVQAEASEYLQTLLSGLFSLAAVGFVTWMIFWMARQSHYIARELHGKVDRALETSAISLAVVAFLAVIREGLETAVFIWSSSQATDGALGALGALLGLATAAVLGFLIFKGALRLNLGAFFKYTGAFLIVVAAGIAAYGVHELQELKLIPILEAKAYDLSALVPEGSFTEVLLKGTLAFRADPSMLEVVIWLAFVAVVGTVYVRSHAKAKREIAAQKAAVQNNTHSKESVSA